MNSAHSHGNFEKILNSIVFCSLSVAKGDLKEYILSDISFSSTSFTEITVGLNGPEKIGASLLNNAKLTEIFWYAETFPIVDA